MLRRLLLVALVCAFALPLCAGDRDNKKDEKKKDGPRWATNFDEALQEAKDRHAPILVYFGSLN